MDNAAPFELNTLLHGPEPGAREAAWEELIAGYTRLLLGVARSFGGGHDEAMERYSYILEKLREGDFRRLRAFQADGRARFSTWLTVAARRLCLDHHRTRYGRSRPERDPEAAVPLRAIRRRLADSLTTDLDTDLLPDAGAASADTARSMPSAIRACAPRSKHCRPATGCCSPCGSRMTSPPPASVAFSDSRRPSTSIAG